MTTGGDIVGTLLRSDEALIAIVAEDNIKLGALPDDAPLPSLLIRTVSSVERQTLKRESTTLTRDRISVTVRAVNYRQQRQIVALVKARCAGRTGTLAGAQRFAILTAGTGPDLRGPGDSYEQAQDFRVAYDA
jgi:hypothetical protein